MEHINQPTAYRPCDHDTQPRAMWQGRTYSTRSTFFVEILGMSWHYDRYVPMANRAEIIRECVSDFARNVGIMPGESPRYFGSRQAPDFRRTEFRISIIGWPHHERGTSKFYVSAVDHAEACFAD